MSTLSDSKHYSGHEPQCLPFPQEILVQIIGLLSKACDRKNARLACKGFAKAGLPSLTYTAHLSVAGGLLERTQAIAEHPVVAKYVTRMVCSGTQLLGSDVNYETFTAWYRSVRPQADLYVPLSFIYEQHVSRDKKEKEIIRCGMDKAVFLLCLQSFVNLERITFTDVPLLEGSRFLARPQWPVVEISGGIWESSSPYQTYAMGIQSLCMQGTNLQQLKLAGSSYAIEDTIFSDASEERYGQMLSVFGKLRHFELSVIVPDPPIPDNAPNRTYGRLRDLLTCATLLLTLKLASSYWPQHPVEEYDSPPMLDVAHLLQGFTWQHLNHLGLRGFVLIGHEDLLGVFDRHRETLESVELMAVRILHHPDPQDTICEAWRHLFDGLRSRAIIFQSLVLSYLEDCFEMDGHCRKPHDPAYHGDRMLQYLRQGGTNPLENPSIHNEVI